MACDVASAAIFLAAEITQVIDSIPWVRCASGNVLIILCCLFSISTIIMAKKEDKRGIELDKDKLLEVKDHFSVCKVQRYRYIKFG